MTFKNKPFFRRFVIFEILLSAIGFVTTINYFFNSGYTGPRAPIQLTSSAQISAVSTDGQAPTELKRSRFLTEEQCVAQFPLLTGPIEEAVARGRFKLERGPAHYDSFIQGRIKDNQLYIITGNDFSRMTNAQVHHVMAALYQLHKAIMTSVEPLPDTIFAFCVLDHPRPNSWNLSQKYHLTEKPNMWPMPHFAYWSWPISFIGTLDETLSRVSQIEETTPWDSKIDKIAWRGSIFFNPVHNLNLRSKLLHQAQGKEWADVEQLEWTGGKGEAASNAISIPDFCKYKYIAYSEGITYSGRLPYHQACESVLITPPPVYLMHTTHLIKPLISDTLGLNSTFHEQEYALRQRRQAWPKSYPAEEANAVFVANDWSDLEEVIQMLRDKPDIARGIARRQRKLYAEDGYLSEAAEMCYWKALIRGWASVVEVDPAEWPEEGMRWESFALIHKTSW